MLLEEDGNVWPSNTLLTKYIWIYASHYHVLVHITVSKSFICSKLLHIHSKYIFFHPISCDVAITNRMFLFNGGCGLSWFTPAAENERPSVHPTAVTPEELQRFCHSAPLLPAGALFSCLLIISHLDTLSNVLARPGTHIHMCTHTHTQTQGSSVIISVYSLGQGCAFLCQYL